MNWKICIALLISLAGISMPQNITGCGGSEDPYNYYTSFFNNQSAGSNQFKPFYYTHYQFLFNYNEPVKQEDVLAKEWAAYCGAGVTQKDAYNFVMRYALKDVSNLYYFIEKNKALQIPDSVSRNSMTSYFKKTKDLEALGYIMFAKKIEPQLTRYYDAWDEKPRDSLLMVKNEAAAVQLHRAAKKEIIKLKYAYQMVRLALYNDRYAEALNKFDAYVSNNTAQSIVQHLCKSLQAGALFKTGRTKEAALMFSRAFAASDVKKVSNYYGFDWSVIKAVPKTEYVQLCSNNEERANMLALFSLGNPGYDLSSLQEIAELAPGTAGLKVLTTREIHKLEERLLTPYLNALPGGDVLYFTYDNTALSDTSFTADRTRAKELAVFSKTMAEKMLQQDQQLFYLNAAAYCAYLAHDLPMAKSFLQEASKAKANSELRDQWNMTNLLVIINSEQKVDQAFESALLPSLQWLQQKATVETRKIGRNFYEEEHPWLNAYQNLTSIILAKKYHAQGNIEREVLMVGLAQYDNDYHANFDNNGANGFLRKRFTSAETERLYNFMKGASQTPFEKFVLTYNAVKLNTVAEFAGTAYLRDHEYAKAIEWFTKMPRKANNGKILKDPFKEILSDREERLAGDTVTTSKLRFARQMLQLQAKMTSSGVADAATLYKMALAFYNTTYYGYAWELVEYYRSGADGYYIPKDGSAFLRDYYGCFTAEEYFQKARAASTDENFKAKCTFMLAKCAQKQVQQPQYGNYANYEQYDSAFDRYKITFQKNKYIDALKADYSKTAFYQKVYNTCSYLNDFLKN